MPAPKASTRASPNPKRLRTKSSLTTESEKVAEVSNAGFIALEEEKTT